MEMQFVINRVMQMSLPEVAFRVKDRLRSKVEYLNLIMGNYTFPVTGDESSQALPVTFSDDNALLLSKANAIAAKRLDLFALRNHYVGPHIDYHKDYKTGRCAPPGVYGKKINYRDSSRIGDIKYIWEINRHLFLFTLARAYSIAQDRRYLDSFEYYLSEWLKQNPFLMGVNWCSSLESAIRLINWTLSWHLVESDMNQRLRDRWRRSQYEHCWYISRNFSAFSSANNHLIGEAAGLFVGAAGLPRFPESDIWRERAYRILIRESAAQTYDDGVNKEQAVSYQQFVLDFLLLAMFIGGAAGVAFPERYQHTIEKMLEFIAAMEDVGGNIPQFGDEDDGLVVDLEQRHAGIYRSLLNTGACIYGRCDFARKQQAMDEKTVVFSSLAANCHIGPGKNKKELPRRFPSGGYYILGDMLNTTTEQKMMFDCGSLGYLAIAAHGHADSLSFFFSAGGYPVFIDPGTYAYHDNRQWRNYFRSTVAHNTLCIDGEDQSVIAGNFMWSRKAHSRILEVSPDSVKGSHDGYKRLKDPVRHVREVVFDREKNEWVLRDHVECQEDHLVAIHFHLDPSCRCEQNDRRVIISFQRGTCTFAADPRMQLEIFEGSTDPVLGWYSPSYDVKVPTKTIRLTAQVHGITHFSTTWSIRFNHI